MTAHSDFLAILDVGHGNSAVLVDANYVVVIDAGPKNGLLSFLEEQEIFKIDVLLLSHADEDHIGGLIGILSSDRFQIGEIRVNSDSLKNSRTWKSLAYELDLQSRKQKIDFAASLDPNDSYTGPNTKVEILAPSVYLTMMGAGGTNRHGRTIETNSISAVIRVLAYDHPVAVLAGDIDDVGLQELLENGAQASAPILVFPHHGGRLGHSVDIEDFVNKLCGAVQPQQVIFSIGRGRTILQQEVIKAVRMSVPGVWIACTQLASQCAVALPIFSPTHLSKVFSKGIEYRKCCAGTILIDLSQAESISPMRKSHQQFVGIVAPAGLCVRR